MYLAYTYYIRSKITGQYYYGFRYKNIKLKRKPEEDFWIKYFTSSKEVKKLINLYGIDSFEFSIIMTDSDYAKCYGYEQSLIQQHMGNELCLNIHCDITQKFLMAGKTKQPLSAETKLKISNAKKGKPSEKKGKPRDEATKQKIRDALIGSTRSAETKSKISATHIRRHTVRDT